MDIFRANGMGWQYWALIVSNENCTAMLYVGRLWKWRTLRAVCGLRLIIDLDRCCAGIGLIDFSMRSVFTFLRMIIHDFFRTLSSRSTGHVLKLSSQRYVWSSPCPHEYWEVVYRLLKYSRNGYARASGSELVGSCGLGMIRLWYRIICKYVSFTFTNTVQAAFRKHLKRSDTKTGPFEVHSGVEAEFSMTATERLLKVRTERLWYI